MTTSRHMFDLGGACALIISDDCANIKQILRNVHKNFTHTKKEKDRQKEPRFFSWVLVRKKLMQNYTYDICQAEAFHNMHHIQRLRRILCIFHWVQFMNSIRSREEEIMRAELIYI